MTGSGKQILILYIYAVIGPIHALSAAFLYPTHPSDFAFTYSHETARVYVEKEFAKLGIPLQTTFKSNVEEETAEKTIEEFVKRGYDLIISTGRQFSTAMYNMAMRYPSKKFVCINGSRSAPNLAIGFPNLHELSYLLGYACAMATQTDIIAYVSAFDAFPSHTKAYNGFYIGAMQRKPGVKVKLAVVNTFIDKLVERKVTEKLIEQGVDCIVSQVNDITVNAVANSKGVFSAGYGADARLLSGEKVMTSILFNWAPYYIEWLMQVYNGTWVPYQELYLGVSAGVLDLAYWSTETPENIRSEINTLFHSMAQNTSFNPFCGEYALEWNTTGCLDSEQINGMTKRLSGIELVMNVTREDVITKVYVDWDHPAAITMAVVVFLLVISSVFCLIDLIRYRDTMVYRASSPVFCAVILLSITLGYISLLFWAGLPTKVSCALRAWLGGIAFCLLYAFVVKLTAKFVTDH